MVQNKQISCWLNKLEKLPHHTEGNHEVVDTYCSTCRNVYWSKAQNLKNYNGILNDKLAELVLKEVKIQFDVIIVCEPEDTKEDIIKTLDIIKNKEYPVANVFITTALSKENEILLKDIAYRYGKSYTFVMSIESEISLRLHPIIQKCTSPYLIFVNPGHEYDDDILNDFDKSVNIDIKPMLVYASEEFYICPKFIYEDHQFAPNPFKEINEYVQSVTTDKRADS